ncbi:YdeI/OmpD-associated family protein [Mesobacillus maritimus]|uniref:YdeI/OmpD-associated family protein n=1 Tax=Mesobacillus maritimus TaxID=1643336 RepID=A0ABS7K0V0_9BACI|nr:YdeI family protein [Mesobacillus maritimus]MBY0095819.1 YdeI/OmpD-associated family protein [Mesobacillus maritimus]
MTMNPKVDEYLREARSWQEEFEKLRMTILDCGLTEELKWNKPCYMYKNKNIVIIQGFKEYCAVMFFRGALLNDPNGILVRPGENSQAQRQIRFTDAQEIMEMKTVLKDYVNQAVVVEKSGLEVNFKKTEEFIIPEELQTKFNEMPSLKSAFYTLTPGRQRAYILYFSKAKQSKTREARIEKYRQNILDGKGLND